MNKETIKRLTHIKHEINDMPCADHSDGLYYTYLSKLIEMRIRQLRTVKR